MQLIVPIGDIVPMMTEPLEIKETIIWYIHTYIYDIYMQNNIASIENKEGHHKYKSQIQEQDRTPAFW